MGLYGRTVNTSDPFFGETEDDGRILIQWAQHTLDTLRGTLRTAREHGLGLSQMLLAAVDSTALRSIEAAAKVALERGRRVASARVTATTTNLGGGKVGVRLDVEIQPSTGGDAVSFQHTWADAADYMARGAA